MIKSNTTINNLYSEINKFIDSSIGKLNEILFEILETDTYAETECEEKVRNLKLDLINYFKDQQKILKNNKKPSDIKIIEEIVFAIICFFDETFICLNWNGKQYWRLDSIEKALNNSQIGGDLIFSKIEKLIIDKNPRDVELAKIYYTLLKLGFKGKYKELNYFEKYEELTEKLHDFYSDYISQNNIFDKPSYLIHRNKYENFIKKESINFIIKFIIIFIISTFIIGEVYWGIALKFN